MISAHGKAGNHSLQYSQRFIFEDSTHSDTHGNLDGCDRQQPSSDTVSEVTSAATTVASPGDSKTMKCTLEDCDAAEACKKKGERTLLTTRKLVRKQGLEI
ncbi:hypothetical protein HAV15_009606 [Penicillium sp. str. |nr:hypothetical protein HAV15_009606 [Penicillium sp. str. \